VCTHDGLVIKVALDGVDWFRRIHAPFWRSELSVVVARTKDCRASVCQQRRTTNGRVAGGGGRHQSGQSSEDGERLHGGGALGCDYRRSEGVYIFFEYLGLSTSRILVQKRDEVIYIEVLWAPCIADSSVTVPAPVWPLR
jgi:hypothetical protein